MDPTGRHRAPLVIWQGGARASISYASEGEEGEGAGDSDKGDDNGEVEGLRPRVSPELALLLAIGSAKDMGTLFSALGAANSSPSHDAWELLARCVDEALAALPETPSEVDGGGVAVVLREALEARRALLCSVADEARRGMLAAGSVHIE